QDNSQSHIAFHSPLVRSKLNTACLVSPSACNVRQDDVVLLRRASFVEFAGPPAAQPRRVLRTVFPKTGLQPSKVQKPTVRAGFRGSLAYVFAGGLLASITGMSGGLQECITSPSYRIWQS